MFIWWPSGPSRLTCSPLKIVYWLFDLCRILYLCNFSVFNVLYGCVTVILSHIITAESAVKLKPTSHFHLMTRPLNSSAPRWTETKAAWLNVKLNNTKPGPSRSTSAPLPVDLEMVSRLGWHIDDPEMTLLVEWREWRPTTTMTQWHTFNGYFPAQCR